MPRQNRPTMPIPRDPPPPMVDDLPFSPAAERNAEPIREVLKAWLPPSAFVLEVASGTGQHARHLAAAEPGWQWQPSDAPADALAVIAARCAGLANVRPPVRLDVREHPWPVEAGAFDAVYAANLLHIAPWEATPALLQGAARCLKPGGCLVVYGPFVVEGEPLAPSNAAFDADLRLRDARWGLRSLARVQDAAREAGLTLAERRAMPANNLMLRFAGER
jgi:SAM-dependent methyltransferase